MGSKDKHVAWIIRNLPKAENFYDLFGGGFSVSHGAVLSKKYTTVHYNEILSDLCTLIRDAIAGKYSYKKFKPEWISKERFDAEKHKSAYIRVIWSFGNNQRAYLFSEEIERYKKSLHNAVVFNEFDDNAKRLLKRDSFRDDLSIYQRRIIVGRLLENGKPLRIQQLEQLQQLQRLERLQQLERLERLERLNVEFSSLDYRDVPIKPNSIIYCDPPYKGTAKYGKEEFDSDSFYRWVKENKNPVFFSEYQAPPGFRLIAQKKAVQRLSPDARALKAEKLYANDAGRQMVYSQNPRPDFR